MIAEQRPNEVLTHHVVASPQALPRTSLARRSQLVVIVCIVFALLAASCSSDDASSGGDSVAGGVEDFTEWAKTNAQPILSLDLDADTGDLEGLATLVGDARVVAVGESVHNVSEQLEMRTRLLSYLVEALGFRLLAVETSMPHAERINSYVLGEEADVDELLRESGTWQLMATTEMRSTIEWIRQYNSTVTDDDFVQFYGIDIATPLPAVESLDTYLRGVDESLADEQSAAFDGLRMLLSQQGDETFQDLQTRYDATPAEGIAAISTQLADLLTQMQASEQEFVAATSASEFDQALRWATVVQQGHESFAVQVSAGAPGSAERVEAGAGVRDPAMADNALWILDQNPEKRMVLWAHNLHIQRNDPDRVFRVGDSFEVAGVTMGSDLDDSLGASYVVIAAALHNGEAAGYGQLPDVDGDSLDAVLDLTGPELFYLDIRPLPEDRPGGVWLRSPQSMRAEIGTLTLVPATNFDAVYSISTGTSAEELG